MEVTRLWYSPEQLAAELGITKGQVLTLIAQGEIEAINVAHVARAPRTSWRIEGAAVAAYLRRQAAPPPAPVLMYGPRPCRSHRYG